MTFKISEEDNIPFASPSDSQLMELEHIRISKPDDDDDAGTQEAIPLSCAFTRQEHCVSESREREESIKRLSSLICTYLIVMSVQIVGGYKANSLAVMTDAAHLLSDVAGLCVSLLAIKVSSWEANPRNSFGFKRLEVLAAFLSVQLIWLVSGAIIYEAIQRLLSRSREVDGEIMFGISAFGFFMNLIMVIWLGHNHSHHHHHHDHHHHHHKHSHKEEEDEEEMDPLKGGTIEEKSSSKEMNINIQGAYLHVMADMIQSLGVMIGGGIIWVKPKWVLVDLICTLVFSAFALAATLPMLKNIFGILMERAPRDIDIEKLERGLRRINGVKVVHDLHVWEITVGRIVLSCHVLPKPGASSIEIINDVRNFCRKTYGIHHVTVQVE
ncbi:Metal tolerance protein B [Hirschfeldia incana]|nr:Metal tolerance protein B [Hirschfeldia incana]